MQEPVLQGQPQLLSLDGSEVRRAELCQALSPHTWGALAPPGRCLCVCRTCVSPWLWRAAGLAPGRAGTHQEPASLPQPRPSFEQSKKEAQRAALPGPPPEGLPLSWQEQEAEKQAALNKGKAPGTSRCPATEGSPCLPGAPSLLLAPCPWFPRRLQPAALLCSTVGIVPPRTKSPAEEEVVPAAGVPRRSTNGMANGLSSRVGLGAGSHQLGWLGRDLKEDHGVQA